MTAEDLARAAKMSRPKLSRFETADRVPSVSDVSAILGALSVEGERWHELVRMANDAAERGWWESYGAGMGKRQAIYANLEHGAVSVREYQSFVVPGLLQVPAYTRARVELTFKQARLPSADLDRIVEAKMMRQRMLARPDGPRYEVVIEEVAVRRPAAPPGVMREQLLRLAALVEESGRVSVRVLPQRAELRDYWLPRSPFTLYRFGGGDPDAVAVDTEILDLVYTESEEVSPYSDLFGRVWESALSAADSADLLRAGAEAGGWGESRHE